MAGASRALVGMVKRAKPPKRAYVRRAAVAAQTNGMMLMKCNVVLDGNTALMLECSPQSLSELIVRMKAHVNG